MAESDPLPKDWWTTSDVARFLDVQPGTVRHYLAIHLMPDPDRTMAGRNFWKPATVRKWNDSRPSTKDKSTD